MKATKRPSALIAGRNAEPKSSLVPGAVDAHPLGGAGLAVADEDVSSVVGVAGDEVLLVRSEGDEAPIGTDRRDATHVARGADPLVSGAVDAHPLGGAGLAVVDEGVKSVVRVARNQVRRIGDEGDVAAVGADRGAETVAVRLVAGAVDADLLGGPRLAVVDEYLFVAVRTSRDEVGGKGGEGDVAAVGGHDGIAGVVIGLVTGAVDAHPLGIAGSGQGAWREGESGQGRGCERDHALQDPRACPGAGGTRLIRGHGKPPCPRGTAVTAPLGSLGVRRLCRWEPPQSLPGL